MPAERTYKNRSLELRRLQNLRRERADAHLRASKQANHSHTSQIELGLSKARGTSRLAWWVAAHVPPGGGPFTNAFERLLMAVANHRASMLDEQRYVDGIARLTKFWPCWLRPPEQWRPRSHNARRQFGALARHLLARYDVPAWFDGVWLEPEGDECAAGNWFVHVAGGQNLRTAPGLPFPLTKLMAHHALQAPDDVSVLQAMRWGQVRGLGGSQRLAQAVITTRLRSRCADEPFWLSALQFFVNNPMLDPHQVGPIVDYLFAQRFEPEPPRVVDGVVHAGVIPQPNLSMKGRTVQSVLRQVDLWHRQLHRASRYGERAWLSCGIPGYSRVEGVPGNQRLFTVTELLTSRELADEGRAMRHCVASYTASCAGGRCAIYSLRVYTDHGVERRLTIEVIIKNRMIVQARGRWNAPGQALDGRVLRAWATVANLSVAPHVMVP